LFFAIQGEGGKKEKLKRNNNKNTPQPSDVAAGSHSTGVSGVVLCY
jgi:hypothetical protein